MSPVSLCPQVPVSLCVTLCHSVSLSPCPLCHSVPRSLCHSVSLCVTVPMSPVSLCPQVPVIALVGNDAGWTQISREQLPLLGSAVGCGLAYSDYHAVAAALGGRGFVLDSAGDSGGDKGGDSGGDSAGDIEDRVVAVLRAAQAECHRGHPVLVNALLGPSDFRQGSVSV
ncbi:2-hydroxyacyl-CoA lyase 2-like isoform X4 [Serinus canaria]|uniref:2-hydroxyacyl-CoA lyase 2-like isoform X4 n=1 Tax=Serinus canaria TaxID=9135 RepID=UPI0021CC6F71|nr:2-hydroxyacyl-CoA lyase 2-like isoform X4 [Serinus canaria]